jgi:porphobilinogen synthase
MVRETCLGVDDLVYPLFVCPGENVRRKIPSMPGHYRLSVDRLVEECKEARDLGIPAVLLFGIPERKDETGSEAFSDKGIVQRAVRALKSEVLELLAITDVCFCEYMSHGHCGVIKDGKVDNDATLDLLGNVALSHARAGADMVAPSDMMDGRVGWIRKALDQEGFTGLPIMSYAAKYASAFYAPFRDAAGSAPQFGDRRSYQMDTANVEEALREVELDIEEGADIIMVKPALAYLDVIYRVKSPFGLPVAAFTVRGEFACIKAAEEKGWLDGQKVMIEVIRSIKRAGADFVLTYFAKQVARLLQKRDETP